MPLLSFEINAKNHLIGLRVNLGLRINLGRRVNLWSHVNLGLRVNGGADETYGSGRLKLGI